MSGDRGHHPVSLPEIKPRHQGSKITQRWTSKSPRPAQARPRRALPHSHCPRLRPKGPPPAPRPAGPINPRKLDLARGPGPRAGHLEWGAGVLLNWTG